MTKYITVKLTQNQVAWIISTLEFEAMYGPQHEGIIGFRKRLLTTLHKARVS